MIRKKEITDRARKASAIRDGESFDSNAEGVGKECGSRELLFFQDRVEGKGERGCRNIFDSWEENRCQRGKGWGSDDEEWGALVKPALVEVNGREGENEVA